MENYLLPVGAVLRADFMRLRQSLGVASREQGCLGESALSVNVWA